MTLTNIEVFSIALFVILAVIFGVAFGFTMGRMTRGEKPPGAGLVDAIKAKPGDATPCDPYFEAMHGAEKPKRIPTIED